MESTVGIERKEEEACCREELRWRVGVEPVKQGVEVRRAAECTTGLRRAGNIHELRWCEAAAAGVDSRFLWASTGLLSGANHGEANHDRNVLEHTDHTEMSFFSWMITITLISYPPLDADDLLDEIATQAGEDPWEIRVASQPKTHPGFER
ncbi:hypothetical protein V6N13_080519 [Hibiscus sabdariffa]